MLVLILSGLISSVAQAATYYVATNGADTNPGSSASPFRTIQKGLDVAQAGDTVRVRPGNYQERVTFPRSGTSTQRITLEGETGAVLDASDPFTPTWTLEGGGFAGYDVYSAPFPAGQAEHVAINDQSVVVLHPFSTQDAFPPFIPYPNDYPYSMWYWQKVIKHGVTDQDLFGYKTGNGWDGVRALASWKNNKVYLKIKPNGNGGPGINPSTMEVKVSLKDTAGITISGVNYITVRSLQIKHGVHAIKIDNSTGAIVEYCDMLPTCQGIRLGGGVAPAGTGGASDTIIRYNEFSMEPYADTSSWDLGSDVWHANKTGGFGDKAAVELRFAGPNHHIHDNYIHDGFDGISTGWNNTVATENLFGANIEVNNNFIVNMIDDALDPSRNCANYKWHHNVVINSHNHIRIRSVYTGPLYLYNNIFIAGPHSLNGVMMFGGAGGQSPDVYIYNNTIDESTDTYTQVAVIYQNQFDVNGTTNYNIYNNLFYGDQYQKGGAVPTWDANGNVYARKGTAWDATYNQSFAQSNGLDLNSDWVTTGPGFVDYQALNVALTATSPARNTGIDLYTRFGFALPGGYGPGYYSGSFPDVGALAYGTPMPTLPFTPPNPPPPPPPPPPPGSTDFAITGGMNHTVYLKNDSTVWAWGRNSMKQLGDGTQTDKTVPTQVLGVGGAGTFTNAIAVGAGSTHSLAVKDDGTVYAWGSNSNGELGINNTTSSATPVQVKGVGGTGFLTGVSKVSGGLGASIALKVDGTVWTWGKNTQGTMGDNTAGNLRKTPVQVVGVGGTGTLTGITAISGGPESQFFMALKNDGTVYAWGYNNKGQLGDGTGTNRPAPVQVKGVGGTGFLTGIVAIAQGLQHSLALKSDGTVYCWGENANGQLGDNTTTNRSTPVQVLGPGGSGFLTGVNILGTSGTQHAIAAKSDGTVWTWGFNNQGQLGINSTTQSKVPVQVWNVAGIEGYLGGVVAVSAGDRHGLGMQADGSVYSWGVNGFGQLGNGTTTGSAVPVETLIP